VTGDEPQAAPPEPAAWLPAADHECFLCRAAAKYNVGSSADRQLFVVARSASATAVLNRYPYNNGHLLVSPARHVGDLKDLTREENGECMDLLSKFTAVYREQMNAGGFNIGLNLGRVAGAGVPGHLHWHLVPRWAGDNNFMPVLAGTRVIPQSLDALWEMLTGALD
jgi:ATP adenylyltransferase